MMHLDEAGFIQTCGEIWSSTLGLTLEPHVPNDADSDEPTFTSSIAINGGWLGALQLRCTESIARHAAVMLLAIDDEQMTRRQLQYAMDQLAYRVAQAMHGILPASSQVQDPAADDDPGIYHALLGMLPASELVLSCEGRPVAVRILQAAND